MKRLQLARRRVTRWFRPPEAERLRRQHPAPHPFLVQPTPEEREATAKDRRG